MSIVIGHQRPHVAVLAGGDSLERAVSLDSGREVHAALGDAGYRATIFDPSRRPLSTLRALKVDACFIALHGGTGEDGTVQRQLDELALPYPGSGPQASRLAMRKSAAKERFLEAGLPTLVDVRFDVDEPCAKIIERTRPLGFPLIVKPDSQGSSLGLRRVDSPDDLAEALAGMADFGGFALAEPLIAGRELTVAVIDRTPLPIIEIVAPRRLFDYAAKYQDSSTRFRFGEGLPNSVVRQVERTAAGAAAALGTHGLVRVDFMLDRSGVAWILEVNTIPGMTRHSLAPMAAARAGMTMSELCDRLLRPCLITEAVG